MGIIKGFFMDLCQAYNVKSAFLLCKNVYPSVMMHEANLVFRVGMKMAFEGIPFELEWSSPYGRHDIAIKDKNTLWGIIEVKHIETENTLQLEKYKRLNVPLSVVHWKTDIDELIEEVKEWIKGKGINVFAINYQASIGTHPPLKKKKKKCPKWLLPIK
jgi:hypothetical protein